MAASLSSFPAPSSKPTKTLLPSYWLLESLFTNHNQLGARVTQCLMCWLSCLWDKQPWKTSSIRSTHYKMWFFFLLVHYAERRVSMVSSLWVLDRCTVWQLRSMSFECLPSPSPALRARREAFTAWGTMWWYVSSYLKVLTQRSHFSLPYPLSNSFLSLSSLLISHPRFKVLQVSFFVFCQPTRTHMEQVSICS